MRKEGHLSNEKTQKSLKQRQATHAQEAAKDLRFVLATYEGRRFFFRILDEICLTFSGSFNNSGSVTSFNEGRRAVGIQLMQEGQQLAPVDYVHMLSERFGTQTADAELKRELEATETDE